MKILIKTPIQNNFREVHKRFNLELFKALKPPLLGLEVTRFDGCKKGDEVHLVVSGQKWVSHITEDFEGEDEIYFVDIGFIMPFPLKSWRHIHRIKKINEHECHVIDDIEFSTGFFVLDKIMQPALFAMFSLRSPVYRRELT